jgi:hypothetical protein
VIIPDIVTVAYGTNDWSTNSYEEFCFNLNAFFERLYENFEYSKIIVITPIWRDVTRNKPFIGITLDELRAQIKKVALSYNNVTVIDGDNLVPPIPSLFSDEYLHPNDDGFDYYSKNLINEVIKSGFKN